MKVTVLLPPGEIFPESHAPLSLVAVCGTPSEFVQVIVVPFATVIVDGPNAMLAIPIVLGEEAVFPPVELVEEFEYGFEELLQPPKTTSPAIAKGLEQSIRILPS